MSRLDDELKSIFRREEPSPDFADRVLARIALQEAAPQPAKSSWWRPLLDLTQSLRWAPQRAQMRWALAGALAILLAGTAGFYRYREVQRERAEGEMARAQVMYALQIASAKLNVAQKKVLATENR
jgi:hypothetical protein